MAEAMRTFSGTLVFVMAVALSAQDAGWVRDWEEAQQKRPERIGSVGRIAPEGEPGVPMVVRGRLLDAGGKPAAGVTIFAYQTDRTGVYNVPGRRGWRLKGWAMSDAQGRFELHTIRPGSYPRTRTPAHIHVTIEGPRLQRRWTEDIQFADDPFARDGLPVSTRNGVQHVDYEIRIADTNKF